MNRFFFLASIAVLAVACARASAQDTVYKCGRQSYAGHPCSARVLDTSEAPVPLARKSGASGASMRQLPGESAEDFELRKRRARLAQTDRDECARIDKQVPFELERTKSVLAQEQEEGAAALARARARAARLHC